MSGAANESADGAPQTGRIYETAETIIAFLEHSERLKSELRHSWLSTGRQESVADHCWQMGLMVLLVSPHLQKPVDFLRSLEMALIHDLVEIEAGDVPVFEDSERRRSRAQRERVAMSRLEELLPEPTGARVASLWREFEEGVTVESRLVRALDDLEVQAQHNLACIDTWEPIEAELALTKTGANCTHDRFLQVLADVVQRHALEKIRGTALGTSAARADSRGHEPRGRAGPGS